MTAALIAHQVSGSGEPVLLLNGGFMTMLAWQPIASALECGYRVVRCDFRGQLMSPGHAPAAIEGHVDDAVAVLDRLGIDAAHVIGTSFGGLVAIVMAARRPSRVRSLAAVTTTDRFTDEAWAAGRPVVQACRDAAEGCGEGARVMELLTPATYSDAFVAANRAMFEERRRVLNAWPPQYFAGHCGILALLEGLDVRADASAIRCPTLVLAAEHDRTFPLERSRALAAAIPGALLEILPGAPHGAVVEMPQAVLPPLQAFLRTVAAPAHPA